jgi:pre-mRNA-splicing factor RBM22/SLT11
MATEDAQKLGEDFPYVCETCLGPNPYLRMMKMPMSRECKISARPYTAFRWKPGAEARYKETIIAPEVAVSKGVCQVCLMDMRFNVPVAVRDRLLGAGADASAKPQSETNKEFFWDQERKSFLDGQMVVGGMTAAPGQVTSAQDFERLQGLSRPNPHYDRNLPKLCSFWMKGKCTRVLNRDCPFRPCNGIHRFPELNSQHKELAKDLTARLDAEGAVAVMKSLDPIVDDIKEKLLDSQRGNRTENIRNRFHGVKDALTEKYEAKLEARGSMNPPEDRTITTLWVGALPEGAPARSNRSAPAAARPTLARRDTGAGA